MLLWFRFDGLFIMSKSTEKFVNDCVESIISDRSDFGPVGVFSNQLSKSVRCMSLSQPGKFFGLSYACNDSEYKANEVVAAVGDIDEITGIVHKKFDVSEGSTGIIRFIKDGIGLE